VGRTFTRIVRTHGSRLVRILDLVPGHETSAVASVYEESPLQREGLASSDIDVRIHAMTHSFRVVAGRLRFTNCHVSFRCTIRRLSVVRRPDAIGNFRMEDDSLSDAVPPACTGGAGYIYGLRILRPFGSALRPTPPLKSF
jgi:hypothetical protein